MEEEKIKEFMRFPSIGELTARVLISEGVESVPELKKLKLDELKSIDHIGEKRAERIYKDIQGEGEEGKELIKEFECPNCSNFLSVDEDECQECNTVLKIEGGVVLPDKGILENPKETLADSERKKLDDESDPGPWFICGSILERMGAKQKALEAYDRVIELDPLYEHIWNAKASVCLSIGKTEEAAKAYKVAFNAHESPMSLMDVPEVPSEKKEIRERILKESDELKEAKEMISKARSSIEQLVGEYDLDYANLRLKLDQATDARLDEEFEEAKKKAEWVVIECEKAKIFEQVIQEAKDILEKLKERDEYKKYKEALDDIEDSVGEEDYSELVQKTQDIIHEMEDIKEDKVGAEKALPEKIDEAKSVLRENRKKPLDLGSLKKNLRSAIKMRELSKEKEALENVEEVIEKGPVISESNELFEEVKGRLKRIVEGDEDLGVSEEIQQELVEKIKEDLKETIELSKKGDYEEVRRTLNNILYALEWEIDKIIKETQLKVTRQEEEEEEEEVTEEVPEEEEPKVTEEVPEEEEPEVTEEVPEEEEPEVTEEVPEEEEQEVPGEEEQEEMDAEEKFDKSKEILADLRKSGLGLAKLKNLIREANQAKKDEDHEQASDRIEKAFEAGHDLKEISRLSKEVEKKIEELDGKALFDADIYEEKLSRCLRSTKLGVYGLSKRLLLDLRNELEEEDFEKKKLTDFEDPTKLLKEKIRDTKELHILVGKSNLDVKADKEHLKKVVVKIKNKEYEGILELLSEGDEKLLEELERELISEAEHLREEVKEMGGGKVNERWVSIFGEEIKSHLAVGHHVDALELFDEIYEFLDSMKDKESELDKHIYSLKIKLAGVEDTGLNVDDEKNILEEVEKAEDLEKAAGLINRIRDSLAEKLVKEIEDKIVETESSLFDEISSDEKIKLLDHLVKCEQSRREEELENMIFYWKMCARVFSEKT